jgi:hypothetical protein
MGRELHLRDWSGLPFWVGQTLTRDLTLSEMPVLMLSMPISDFSVCCTTPTSLSNQGLCFFPRPTLLLDPNPPETEAEVSAYFRVPIYQFLLTLF